MLQILSCSEMPLWCKCKLQYGNELVFALYTCFPIQLPINTFKLNVLKLFTVVNPRDRTDSFVVQNSTK